MGGVRKGGKEWRKADPVVESSEPEVPTLGEKRRLASGGWQKWDDQRQEWVDWNSDSGRRRRK